jgi:hypothetical protein
VPSLQYARLWPSNLLPGLQGITTGLFDMALAFGAENVPRGPVTVTAEESPDRYIGGDHMMAGYALRIRRGTIGKCLIH